MSIINMALEDIDELRSVISNISPDDCETFEQEVFRAKRIFVVAAGRSLLAMKFFAMRLMQIGFTTYIVGDVCTPSIQAGDLLIVGSGSGETPSILRITQKAKSIGARVAVMTKNDKSAIAMLADSSVQLNTRTRIREGSATSKGQNDADYCSIRPSGNPFEQSIVIFSDAVICSLMCKLGRGTDYIAANHANLE